LKVVQVDEWILTIAEKSGTKERYGLSTTFSVKELFVKER
jgi:hypothetical protein